MGGSDQGARNRISFRLGDWFDVGMLYGRCMHSRYKIPRKECRILRSHLCTSVSCRRQLLRRRLQALSTPPPRPPSLSKRSRVVFNTAEASLRSLHINDRSGIRTHIHKLQGVQESAFSFCAETMSSETCLRSGRLPEQILRFGRTSRLGNSGAEVVLTGTVLGLPCAHWNGKAHSASRCIRVSHSTFVRASLNMMALLQARELSMSRRP